MAGEAEGMTDPKGSNATVTADGAGVQARNANHVAMEDLAEEDKREFEREHEEEMAERRHKKLACFQKTRKGVVKKGDTVAAP
jgi:hypothetical protein